MSPIPIVMTATVVPNVSGAASADPAERRGEYLRAVRFYSGLADRVFFLENSDYPLDEDPAFRDQKRLLIRKFPRSASPERGKGFQEFEMLDAWVASEADCPPCWIKVTGRYIVRNMDKILAECERDSGHSIIVDQTPRSEKARTSLFFAKTEFYRQRLRGLYRRCDDRSGAWIERIMFRELADLGSDQCRFFRSRPSLHAIAGGSGKTYPVCRTSGLLKDIGRAATRWVDSKYLWLSR